jgi:hypothetical protein
MVRPKPTGELALRRRQFLLILASATCSPALARAVDLLSHGGTPQPPATNFPSAPERRLIAALAETIIPATDTPGAREAGVHDFIAMMVNETFTDPDRAAFRDGLAAIEALSRDRYGNAYARLAQSEQAALLEAVALGRISTPRPQGSAPEEFFRVLKELTVIGYYTSEIGATVELAHMIAPGSYLGCTDMTAEQRAWSYGSTLDGLF